MTAEYLRIPKTPTATTVYFAFGRFQPPTIGHRKVFETMKALAAAANADYFIVPSHTCDAVQTFIDLDAAAKSKCSKVQNPLTLTQKLFYLEKMYPNDHKHLINIETLVERYKELLAESNLSFPTHKTFATVAQILFLCGYTQVYLVVGSDEYESLMLLDPSGKRRKGTESRSTFADSIRKSFNTLRSLRSSIAQLPEASFHLENAGRRLETANTIEGMSGTKMRKAAADCQYALFRQGIPDTLSETDCQSLFHLLRQSQGKTSPCDT
jgi:nicotinic acid mononucleotide adenylyltransferase